MIQRRPLSATEEAFVAMVLEEHAALVRHADQKRDQRMAVLLAEKNIPNGPHVRVEKAEDGASAALVFDDGEPTPSVAEAVGDDASESESAS